MRGPVGPRTHLFSFPHPNYLTNTQGEKTYDADGQRSPRRSQSCSPVRQNKQNTIVHSATQHTWVQNSARKTTVGGTEASLPSPLDSLKHSDPDKLNPELIRNCKGPQIAKQPGKRRMKLEDSHFLISILQIQSNHSGVVEAIETNRENSPEAQP